ncbi:exported hypothetical protein [Rubrivivax sp. A210]|uniref:phage exclusion protein Lit family protein n=1 Tax=Rubrivivax sp. A210 TaxID=2772301 RepID=UPI00191B2ABA|nr:phage exclusion protein Lit family protein [Rubrivivax sp. A210]CAD5375074.1 exported hypothetical protein [Rubrivivax sp. A210]
MKRRSVLSMPLAALAAMPAAAAPGTMYPDSLLASRVADYREVMEDNLRRVFLPALSAQQRAALSSVKLEFPLRGRQNTPFEFFATGDQRVHLPVFSIRFLSDLAIAQTWLLMRDYRSNTVYEYISLMKYQQRPRDDWPDPRTALQIPADATQDQQVDQFSLHLLNQALAFILLHELAHIVHRDPGYGPGVARAAARGNEASADAFALEVMRRIGMPPLGVEFFFAVMSHHGRVRADFLSAGDYQKWLDEATHPLDTDRMRAVARYMQAHAADFAKLQRDPRRSEQVVGAVAGQVDQIARYLEDLDLQRLIAARARAASIASLAPRKH